MKSKVSILVVFSVIVTALFAAATLAIYSRAQEGSTSLRKKKIEQNQDPIAEYVSQSFPNAEEDNLRKTRNSEYDLKSPAINSQNAKSFELNEESQTILYGGHWSTTRRKSALPISESSCIVKGELTSANAFLSNDKTNVYSEFNFIIEDVLKQNAEQPVSNGNSIILNRFGGKVRLASGKLLHRGTNGQQLPKVNKRYVMFLNYSKDTDSYRIITGYELQSGKVNPIDGQDEDARIAKIYEEHQQYKDIDEAVFLNIIRNAVSTSVLEYKKKGGQK